jgi:hypothetical protein
VPQQAYPARKLTSPLLKTHPGIGIRSIRHTGGHSASNSGLTHELADMSVRPTHKLFSESRLHRDPLAPLGAPAGNDLLAALGLHARAKSVSLGSLAPVGLECTLGHEK